MVVTGWYLAAYESMLESGTMIQYYDITMFSFDIALTLTFDTPSNHHISFPRPFSLPDIHHCLHFTFL